LEAFNKKVLNSIESLDGAIEHSDMVLYSRKIYGQYMPSSDEVCWHRSFKVKVVEVKAQFSMVTKARDSISAFIADLQDQFEELKERFETCEFPIHRDMGYISGLDFAIKTITEVITDE